MSKVSKFIIFTFVASFLVCICISGDMMREGAGNMMSASFGLRINMMMPAIGALIAGAKIKQMGWKPDISSNKKYILLAWLMPAVFEITGAAVYYMVFREDLASSGIFLRDIDQHVYDELQKTGGSYAWYVIKEIFFSLTSYMSFASVLFAFGEEIGWRGFLFPELKERFGRTKGRIIGGVLHGIWHFPLIIIAGYEYGRHYIGAPVLGPLVFTLFCVATGIIMDHLYERSESIWLPAIFHGMTNVTISSAIVRAPGHLERVILGPMDIGLIAMIPLICAAVLITYIENKRENLEFEDF